ncbi:MAG TPA: hypothetical protein LFW20_05135 [Rickettsia endosymbiont of Omalisus fontisbellaquei]|nr:hypothetical protein [Rickettsia endosymbiont of Omalisus fontisbellaquei]
MLVNEEEFKKQPDVINLPEWKKSFYYIIDVGHYENYEEAMDCIIKNLKNPEESLQAAAIQALDIVVRRFSNIKDKLILPILFKNLKSESERIRYETIDTLGTIADYIFKLRRKICLEYFKNGIDFFTRTELKKHTDKSLIYSLNDKEEKIEFILSFCQNSSNYNEALEVCLYFLQEENEDIYIAAFQGLNYIVIRFQKINFYVILPLIKKFLKLAESRVCDYAEALLVDIAIMIPELREKVIPF